MAYHRNLECSIGPDGFPNVVRGGELLLMELNHGAYSDKLRIFPGPIVQCIGDSQRGGKVDYGVNVDISYPP